MIAKCANCIHGELLLNPLHEDFSAMLGMPAPPRRIVCMKQTLPHPSPLPEEKLAQHFHVAYAVHDTQDVCEDWADLATADTKMNRDMIRGDLP